LPLVDTHPVAKGCQILVHQRVATTIEDLVDLEEIGPLTLKGLLRPVSAFNIVRLKGSI
jgi:class 3 adenylate cyclase